MSRSNPEHRLMAFITERHNVWRNKTAGKPWPWTSDPILQQYRFCNVFRNLDKETIALHNGWLNKLKHKDDLWFACVVGRLVNWWPTLSMLKLPLPWDPVDFVHKMDARKAAGKKVFTGAYMVRADAVIGGSKAQYLADYVLTPMWHDRDMIRPNRKDTLESFHQRLMRYRDMGSFMAAQVVADAKYFDRHLLNAPDWFTWAASGPGSRRGLAIVLGLDVNYNWKEQEWRLAFTALHERLAAELEVLLGQPITGQDLQNCLCEYFKYTRGSCRSKYAPPST